MSDGESDRGDSDLGFVTDDFGATTEGPPKRRRTSESASSDDGFVPQRPLVQTTSRIKKKADVQKTRAQEPEQGPVTISDALANGPVAAGTGTSFSSLGLAPWLVGSLAAMAITRPTVIQRQCIPGILKGKDCIGGSRTGSGKTVAFAAPILHKWSIDPFGIFALVLTPTRYELIHSADRLANKY